MEPTETDVKILLQAFGFADPAVDTSVPAPLVPTAPVPALPMPASAAPMPFAEGQITADKAIADLARLFRSLQLQAGRILAVFGASAPCEIINRHHAAVEQYRAVAAQVLGQLAKQGFTVVQQLYGADGKQTGEQMGPTPVLPAFFEPCNKAMAGALGFARSPEWGNVVVNIGAVTDQNGLRPLVSWIGILLVANGTVVSVTHTVVINWPAVEVKQIDALGTAMDTYLSCLEQTLRASPQISHEQADAHCRGLPVPPLAVTPFNTTLLFVLGLLAVSALGGFVLWRAYRRDEVERLAPDFDPNLPDELLPETTVGADMGGEPLLLEGLEPLPFEGGSLEDAYVVGGPDLTDALAELEDSSEPRYFRRHAWR
jgi:hypothetical protein